MRVDVRTKNHINSFTVIDLDRKQRSCETIHIDDEWHKLIIPCARRDILDVIVGDESIRHGLNSGINTARGYEIWLHGNLAEYFSRISKCIAHDDLLTFKNLEKKYMLTESWNEPVHGDFIPTHVKDFFAKGEGPNWYSLHDFNNLPYVTYDGPAIDRDLYLLDDLQYEDVKFYGQGRCRSLKQKPVLPTIPLDRVQNDKLRESLQEFGFTDILQMQYVELQPGSALPVHRDDFTYEDARHIIDGPSQLYFVLSGEADKIKLKFKNVGLIDVSKPIFINNHRFVHSLVYTGQQARGVFLAYGQRDPKKKQGIDLPNN